MISENTLRAAVERSLITADQALGLRRLEQAALSNEPRDDEKLRFISGFADIFVTIGLGLFLGSLGWFGLAPLGLSGTALLIAAACWLLAEFFTRRQRQALPSIVLLVTFAASVFLAVFQGIAALPGDSALPFLLHLDEAKEPWALIAAALVTVGAAWFHYLRFRVPITFAAGMAALVVAFLGAVYLLSPAFVAEFWRLLLLASGVAVFVLALRFDLSDPQRLTRRTDIAFWLHMLAAPLIVHSLIGGLWAAGGAGQGPAWIILGVFAGLGVVALLVDRRAILVSGLSYAGFAFGTLVARSVDGESVVPLTLLALGSLILLLSAGWHALRRLLLRTLPPALARGLPHADMSANKAVLSESPT